MFIKLDDYGGYINTKRISELRYMPMMTEHDGMQTQPTMAIDRGPCWEHIVISEKDYRKIEKALLEEMKQNG